jgi:SulP family sulfate permease
LSEAAPVVPDVEAKRSRLSHAISFLDGIRPYDRTWLTNDVVAGVTLAALAIPEVMGYSKIAGTPVITGLYTILIPIAVFAVLGSSRHLVVGGDSATAAIMYAGIAGLGISGLEPNTPQWLGFASLSALITAGLLVLARVARLGFLADFISRTVLVGFLTGVGIQVAMGQVGGMLGVPSPDVATNALSGTVRKFALTIWHIGEGSWQTVVVSVSVLAILMFFGRLTKVIPAGLVAVVGAIAVSWIFDLSAHNISTLGPVPAGLPHIGLPQYVGWSDVPKLLAVAASMFLVVLAQSAATSRAYAVKYSEKMSENTDLVGLGLANLAAGFSSTFPVNGSPTKTEMVDEAKSRTQVAQLTTAVVVAIVLLFLTKPLQYLPNAVLAAVVFLIGVKLIAVTAMREILRLRRDEFVVAVVTAAVVVAVGVEQGIILAIVLSLLLHVRRHYSPVNAVVTVENGRTRMLRPAPGVASEPGLLIYRFGAGLFYANATRFEEEIDELVASGESISWFVLLADAIDDLDFTGGKTLAELVDRLLEKGIVVGIVDPDSRVRAELERFGITEKIGSDKIFDDVPAAAAAFAASR